MRKTNMDDVSKYDANAYSNLIKTSETEYVYKTTNKKERHLLN